MSSLNIKWTVAQDYNGLKGGIHEVRIYKEYHSVCPFVGIGTLPTPLPLPEPGEGGGGTLACGWGVGESQFRRLEKSLALCLHCGGNTV
jgi:hypothetical protein